MKRILFLLLVVFCWGCDSDQVPDCLKTTGKKVSKTYDLPPFHQIMTYNNIQLFIADRPTQQVVVETGENLLENIEISVKNGRLEIKNHTRCNWFRGYKRTAVYVSAPNLDYIKNGSQFDVISTNTLHYDSLVLVSEKWQDSGDYHTDGNFKLQLDCHKLHIVTNFLSNYYLSGQVDYLNIGVYSGDGRIEAADLIVQKAHIYHRGSNAVTLNPQQSITGKLVSTGDLILVNRPQNVEIERLYTGKVIYR